MDKVFFCVPELINLFLKCKFSNGFLKIVTFIVDLIFAVAELIFVLVTSELVEVDADASADVDASVEGLHVEDVDADVNVQLVSSLRSGTIFLLVLVCVFCLFTFIAIVRTVYKRSDDEKFFKGLMATTICMLCVDVSFVAFTVLYSFERGEGVFRTEIWPDYLRVIVLSLEVAFSVFDAIYLLCLVCDPESDEYTFDP